MDNLKQSYLPDLLLTGMDTDGDKKNDTLLDVYNVKTGQDLYNRPGEQDNTQEAL